MKPFQRQRKVRMRVTSFVTAAVFFAFSNLSYAERSEVFLPRSPEIIRIPEEIGTLQSVHLAGFPSVVLLEDAHGQLEAQENLVRLLQYLQGAYGYKTLFLEGGIEGALSGDLLRLFREEPVNQKIGESLLRKNVIGGPELFLLNTQGGIRAFGVERPSLYRKDLFLFRSVYSDRETVERFLLELETEIRKAAARGLNRRLKNFVNAQAVLQEQGNLSAELNSLAKWGEEVLKIDPAQTFRQWEYPQLVRFMKLQELEKQNSGAREAGGIQLEKRKLMTWLKKKGWDARYQRDFESLWAETPPFSVRSFLEEFYEQTHESGFSFEDYPFLKSFFAGKILHQELDAVALSGEMKILEERIGEALVKTKQEKEILSLLKDYVLLEKLLSLDLSRDEFLGLRRDEPIFRPLHFQKRLSAFREGGKAPRLSELDLIDLIFEKALRFYEVALKREQAILKNLLATLLEKREGKVVLVAGGFHTPAFENWLGQSGLTTFTVTPRIHTLQGRSVYLERMLLRSMPGRATLAQTSPGRMSLPEMGLKISPEDERYHRHELWRAIGENLRGSVPVTAGPGLRTQGLFELFSKNPRSEVRVDAEQNALLTHFFEVWEDSRRRLPSYSLSKTVTLIRELRSRKFSLKQYERIPLMEAAKRFLGDFESLAEKRIVNLLEAQAAAPEQALVELVKNGQDWSAPGTRSGRHGQGGLQVLGELQTASDAVVLETRKKGKTGVRFVFWRSGHDVFFNYELVTNQAFPYGTRFGVLKNLTPIEQNQRARHLAQKVKVNTRSRILFNGELLNHPEAYEYLNGKEGGTVPAEAPPVTVWMGERGYGVQDIGEGMDLKGVFENFLNPRHSESGEKRQVDSGKRRDVRLFSSPHKSFKTTVEAWLNGYRIERHEGTRDERLNLVEELILEFPKATFAPSSWDVIELDREGIRGMKEMIDLLTDLRREVPNRFAKINSLALFIRIKQPDPERRSLQSQGRRKDDLMDYLRLKTGPLVRSFVEREFIFAPNSLDWFPFYSREEVILLDEELFDFRLETLVDSGLLRPAPPELEDLAQRVDPVRGLKVYTASFDFPEEAEPVILATENGEPFLMVDESAYQRHKEDTEFFRGIFERLEFPEKKPARTPVEPEEGRFKKLLLKIFIWISSLPPWFKRVLLWGGAALLVFSIGLKIYRYAYPPNLIPANRPAATSFQPEPPEVRVRPKEDEEAEVEVEIKTSLAPSFDRFLARKETVSRTVPLRLASPGSGKISREVFAAIEGYTGKPLIRQVFTTMGEDGKWLADRPVTKKPAEGSRPTGEFSTIRTSGKVSAGDVLNLLNYPEGIIEDSDIRVTVLDSRGRAVQGTDPGLIVERVGDQLKFKGSAWVEVEWKITVYDQATDYEFDSPEIPDAEMEDVLRVYGEELGLVPDKHGRAHSDQPDREKLRKIRKTLNEHFVYDAQTGFFQHNGRSWVSTAEEEEKENKAKGDKKSPSKVTCSCSAALTFLFSRTSGMPALYVEVDFPEGGSFFKGSIGHAAALLKVGGRWKYEESTGWLNVEKGLPGFRIKREDSKISRRDRNPNTVILDEERRDQVFETSGGRHYRIYKRYSRYEDEFLDRDLLDEEGRGIEEEFPWLARYLSDDAELRGRLFEGALFIQSGGKQYLLIRNLERVVSLGQALSYSVLIDQEGNFATVPVEAVRIGITEVRRISPPREEHYGDYELTLKNGMKEVARYQERDEGTGYLEGQPIRRFIQSVDRVFYPPHAPLLPYFLVSLHGDGQDHTSEIPGPGETPLAGLLSQDGRFYPLPENVAFSEIKGIHDRLDDRRRSYLVLELGDGQKVFLAEQSDPFMSPSSTDSLPLDGYRLGKEVEQVVALHRRQRGTQDDFFLQVRFKDGRETILDSKGEDLLSKNSFKIVKNYFGSFFAGDDFPEEAPFLVEVVGNVGDHYLLTPTGNFLDEYRFEFPGGKLPEGISNRDFNRKAFKKAYALPGSGVPVVWLECPGDKQLLFALDPVKRVAHNIFVYDQPLPLRDLDNFDWHLSAGFLRNRWKNNELAGANYFVMLDVLGVSRVQATRVWFGSDPLPTTRWDYFAENPVWKDVKRTVRFLTYLSRPLAVVELQDGRFTLLDEKEELSPEIVQDFFRRQGLSVEDVIGILGLKGKEWLVIADPKHSGEGFFQLVFTPLELVFSPDLPRSIGLGKEVHRVQIPGQSHPTGFLGLKEKGQFQEMPGGGFRMKSLFTGSHTDTIYFRFNPFGTDLSSFIVTNRWSAYGAPVRFGSIDSAYVEGGVPLPFAAETSEGKPGEEWFRPLQYRKGRFFVAGMGMGPGDLQQFLLGPKGDIFRFMKGRQEIGHIEDIVSFERKSRDPFEQSSEALILVIMHGGEKKLFNQDGTEIKFRHPDDRVKAMLGEFPSSHVSRRNLVHLKISSAADASSYYVLIDVDGRDLLGNFPGKGRRLQLHEMEEETLFEIHKDGDDDPEGPTLADTQRDLLEEFKEQNHVFKIIQIEKESLNDFKITYVNDQGMKTSRIIRLGPMTKAALEELDEEPGIQVENRDPSFGPRLTVVGQRNPGLPRRFEEIIRKIPGVERFVEYAQLDQLHQLRIFKKEEALNKVVRALVIAAFLIMPLAVFYCLFRFFRELALWLACFSPVKALVLLVKGALKLAKKVLFALPQILLILFVGTPVMLFWHLPPWMITGILLYLEDLERYLCFKAVTLILGIPESYQMVGSDFRETSISDIKGHNFYELPPSGYSPAGIRKILSKTSHREDWQGGYKDLPSWWSLLTQFPKGRFEVAAFYQKGFWKKLWRFRRLFKKIIYLKNVWGFPSDPIEPFFSIRDRENGHQWRILNKKFVVSDEVRRNWLARKLKGDPEEEFLDTPEVFLDMGGEKILTGNFSSMILDYEYSPKPARRVSYYEMKRRIVAREWSPLYLFLDSPLMPDVLDERLVQEGEALLDQAVQADPEKLKQILKLLYLANDILGRDSLEGREGIAARLIRMANRDLELASRLVHDLDRHVPIPQGFSRYGLDLLEDFDANRHRFDPSCQTYLAYLVHGGGNFLKDEEPEKIDLKETSSLSPENRGISLAWLIDLPVDYFKKRGIKKISGLEEVDEGLKATVRQDRPAKSEEEMVKVVSSQDKKRKVWVREGVQNARDAILEGIKAGEIRPENAVIKLRSYLHREHAGALLQWHRSIEDPFGMDLDRIVNKYFPPDESTKSVESVVTEILESEAPPQEKAQAVQRRLFKQEFAEDPAIRAGLEELFARETDPKKVTSELAGQYASKMEAAWDGLFGIGNYTFYADSDEVVLVSGRGGKLYKIHLKVRKDPGENVTGLLLLNAVEYDDPEGRYKGTRVDSIKTVDENDLEGISLEDIYLKYLFQRYAGGISNVRIIFVDEAGEALRDEETGELLFRVQDKRTPLSQAGNVTLLTSQMQIGRLSVGELFVADPLQGPLGKVAGWEKAHLHQKSINLEFQRGTPVNMTRTSLRNPPAHEENVAVAVHTLMVRDYRGGEVTIPGLPDYEEFLRDWRSLPALYETGTKVLSDAGEPEGLTTLLLNLKASDRSGRQISLSEEKKELYFRYVPEWLKTAFLSHEGRWAEIASEDLSSLSSPVSGPESFGKRFTFYLFHLVVRLYLNGEIEIPGLVPFSEYSLEKTPALQPDARVRKDISLIQQGRVLDLGFENYLETGEKIAPLLVSLPLRGGKSVNDLKKELEEKRRREEEERRRRELEEKRRRELEGRRRGDQAVQKKKLEPVSKPLHSVEESIRLATGVLELNSGDYPITHVFSLFLDKVFRLLLEEADAEVFKQKGAIHSVWDLARNDPVLDSFLLFLEGDESDLFEEVLRRTLPARGEGFHFFSELLKSDLTQARLRRELLEVYDLDMLKTSRKQFASRMTENRKKAFKVLLRHSATRAEVRGFLPVTISSRVTVAEEAAEGTVALNLRSELRRALYQALDEHRSRETAGSWVTGFLNSLFLEEVSTRSSA